MDELPGNPDALGTGLLRKVRQTIGRHNMIRQGDTVVAGISGGPDSMCLLDVLHRLKKEEMLQVVVAHLHHGLRGEEAERDFRFVEQQAARYCIPFEGDRIPARSYSVGENLQAKARELRYSFFDKVAMKWNAARIATGHHLDDRVETILMQLFRGTGSLRGISPVRGERYVRPLAEIRREEILQYVTQRGIAYVEDSSNQKVRYLRNRMRRELVPVIRSRINPSFEDSLLRLSDIVGEERKCLDEMAGLEFERSLLEDSSPNRIVLKRERLLAMGKALQRRVIRLAYQRIRGSTMGLSLAPVDEVCRHLAAGGGDAHRRFSLPGGVQAFMEYGEVLFSGEDLWDCRPYRYLLRLGECLPVPEAGAVIEGRLISPATIRPEDLRDTRQAFLSLMREPGEVVIRNFRAGDRFRPVGLGGEKKLKDFFMDRKIPRSLRCRIPILDIDGRIAWVAGYRVDERFRLMEDRQVCLRVSVRDE